LDIFAFQRVTGNEDVAEAPAFLWDLVALIKEISTLRIDADPRGEIVQVPRYGQVGIRRNRK
jgi:hypothetical protein